MHDDEVPIDEGLVRRLLAGAFPAWADLALEAVPSAGTDHALYRLGEDKSVRLPRIDWATGQAEFEAEWAPRLAPHLPFAIPVPLGVGEPAEGYPWRWGVYPWLPGEALDRDPAHDPAQLARDLAAFVVALRSIDAADAPRGGRSSRVGELLARDGDVRGDVATLGDMVDGAALLAAWEDALRAPPWGGPATWAHSDLLPGNLLLVDGRLSAVIDLGGMRAGDPAVDAMPGWTTLPRDVRWIYREALGVDDATWDRGRGWAIVFAVAALPYYRETNPTLANIAARTIDAVLRERAAG